MNKKTVEFVLKDEGNKFIKFGLSNPIDEINVEDVNTLESMLIDSNVFIGQAGKIIGFEKVYVREIIETSIL